MRSSLKRRHGFPHKRRWAKTFVGGQTLPVTFPNSPLVTRAYIALGADLTQSHLTWNWLDITDRVRHDLGISVTTGRRDGSEQVTASRCQLKIENDDGYFCRRNQFGPYYGLLTKNTPIWIQLDPGSGFVDRYHGYINEWPTRWTDESATDCTVTIQCAGVMRRLAQGRVLRSPVYRSISGLTPGSLRPIAYWPMEDGSGSTQFSSGLAGQSPVTPAGSLTYAANSDLDGSESLPSFGAGAWLSLPIPVYPITGAWMVHLVINVPDAPAGDVALAQIFTGGGGTIVRYDLLISPSPLPQVLTVCGYDSAGVLRTQVFVSLDGSSPANPTPADFYGQSWSVRVAERAEIVGGIVSYLFLASETGAYAVAGVPLASSSPSTVLSATLRGAIDSTIFGHFGLHADVSLVTTSFTSHVLAGAGALSGWTGEQAHERVKRLCREEGIPARSLAAESVAMGPQGFSTLLTELRACEAVDQGFLYEHEFGVAYQALSERYNRPVAFSLDFDAQQIAGTPEPADDDQRLVNKFTSSRSGGSSSTAEQETGTLGTGPGGSGVYESSAVVGVQTDAQLADHATWKVHLGTVDEDRWPVLPFRLHGSPELITAWLATTPGDRVNAANPPAQMNQDTIDQIIEGYTERWDTVSWVASLNTSPASPYRIFTLEDADLGLIDSGTSTLAAAASAGAGSLSVATSTAADLWSTSGTDYPLTIQVSGIDITVTAVSGASSPQTFTVTAATVAKGLAAGEPVELANPVYLGM